MGIGKIFGNGGKAVIKAVEETASVDFKALKRANSQLLKESLDAIDDKGALKSYALGASDAWKKLEDLNKKLH